MAEENPAAQRQTAVIAYFTSKQLLLFVFSRLSVCQYLMAEEDPAAQRQTTVTAYFISKQLLLFLFALLTCDNAAASHSKDPPLWGTRGCKVACSASDDQVSKYNWMSGEQCYLIHIAPSSRSAPGTV